MRMIKPEDNGRTRRNGTMTGLGIWKRSFSSATNEQLCELEHVILALWASVFTNVNITGVKPNKLWSYFTHSETSDWSVKVTQILLGILAISLEAWEHFWEITQVCQLLGSRAMFSKNTGQIEVHFLEVRGFLGKKLSCKTEVYILAKPHVPRSVWHSDVGHRDQ